MTRKDNPSHHPHYARIFAAGFAATILMTILLYDGPSIDLPRLDIAAMIGSFLTGGLPAAWMSAVWWTGMAFHFFDLSILFPMIYASWVYGWFKGPSLLRGVAYGIALWLFSEAIEMPIVGAGFFNDHSAAEGAVVAALFFAHVLYGCVLGGMGGQQAEPGDAPEPYVDQALARHASKLKVHPSKGGTNMLSWVLIFFILAVVGVEMDFRHIVGVASEVAKVLFFVLLVALVITAIRRGLAGKNSETTGHNATRKGEANDLQDTRLSSSFTKQPLRSRLTQVERRSP